VSPLEVFRIYCGGSRSAVAGPTTLLSHCKIIAVRTVFGEFGTRERRRCLDRTVPNSGARLGDGRVDEPLGVLDGGRSCSVENGE
jgi:hypothetical protein